MSTSQRDTDVPDLTGAASSPAATNRRFEELMNGGDPAAAARAAYTRDARVLPPGAPALTGREAAAEFWTAAARQLGIVRVALHTEMIEAAGEDGAYEVGRATLALAGGQEASAKYVVVWRREDGAWRWHVDIWNMDG